MLLDMPCPCLFMDMILVHRMLVTYRIKQVSKGCPPPKSPDPDTYLRELHRSTEIVYLTIYHFLYKSSLKSAKTFNKLQSLQIPNYDLNL